MNAQRQAREASTPAKCPTGFLGVDLSGYPLKTLLERQGNVTKQPHGPESLEG